MQHSFFSKVHHQRRNSEAGTVQFFFTQQRNNLFQIAVCSIDTILLCQIRPDVCFRVVTRVAADTDMELCRAEVLFCSPHEPIEGLLFVVGREPIVPNVVLGWRKTRFC